MESRVMEFNFRDKTFKAVVVDRITNDPSWFTHQDEANVRERDWNVAEGDVVLDIGSAYGSYTLTALAVGALYVVCFNPNKEENEILRQSLVLNGWDDRCRIIEEGLFSKTGWLEDSSQVFSETEAPEFFHVCALDDMDLQLHEGDNIWVKMDVEGAEVEVLKGMKQFLANFLPTLLIENHQFKDSTIQERVETKLASLGYGAVSHHSYHSVSHSLYKHGHPRL